MAASKSGFMKDALILFAITLVSGLCLGVVYDVTKAPIEAATIAANNATYKQVLPEAESFDDVEGSTEKIAETADEIANLGFGGVAIESVLEAKDASGEVVGHVINSLSNDSYGGAVKLSIGFKPRPGVSLVSRIPTPVIVPSASKPMESLTAPP